jgi:SAM-dependent methyltransferase
MIPGGQFQVETIRRLLPSGDQLSAVYALSADRPGWSAILELARQGAAVKVLCRAAAAPEIRKLAQAIPTLSVQEVPAGVIHFGEIAAQTAYSLLVIDEHAWQRDLLRDVLAAGVKPNLIVARDGSEDALVRQAKYELLIQMNYYFAGMTGDYSLWTAAKQPANNGLDSAPMVLSELPQALKILPVKSSGVVQMDVVMAPPGQILQIPVRADFSISGWAMIAADQSPAVHIFARARHEETGVEEYLRLPREARPDVLGHFGTENLLMTGFRADLSPLCHRIGTHDVSIVQSDGSFLYESGQLFRFAIALQEYELTSRVGLANRYIRGSGIEIGALQKPTRLNGAVQVRYIDRMSLQKLLEHYPEMAQIPVQAPDIVDDGQLLQHIAEDSQDFAIANHFLEHCPDPIRSIHNMLRVVKQGGILYLAVPDKRHTFDLRRPITPYGALKSAYVSGQRAGCAELFYEWSHLVYNLPPAEAAIRGKRLMEEDYSIHYNVWATADLLNFLLTAQHDFQIPFELVAVVSSENETIVLLERTAGRLPI